MWFMFYTNTDHKNH